jgi:hypothetical protein
LPPDIDIRVLGLKGSAARNVMLSVPPPRDWASHLPIATEDDFKAVDVLFTDSITKNFVRHRQCINYDLLSQESLRTIAAVKLSNGAQPRRSQFGRG